MDSKITSTDLFAKNVRFTDRDLTFLVHAHHDAEELAPMLSELRAWYPESRVIVCSDGDNDPRLPELAEAARAEFHLGENLYRGDRAGEICHRMLELFMHQPTRYLFKVDPDTGFHRRFRFLPAHSGMFGTVQSHTLFSSIQGGCFGITLDWAARLCESAAMRDPLLQDAGRTWAAYRPLWHYFQRVNRVSSDWLFGYVATTLGIPQFGFTEVMCKWQTPTENSDLKYATTHPVKRP